MMIDLWCSMFLLGASLAVTPMGRCIPHSWTMLKARDDSVWLVAPRTLLKSDTTGLWMSYGDELDERGW